MILKFLKISVAALIIRLPCISYALHSRANFDDTRDITLTGTIVDYSWRNPHVYFEIQADDEAGINRNWMVEAHSVTGMRGQGWDANTLSPGTEVTISGQPDRKPENISSC